MRRMGWMLAVLLLAMPVAADECKTEEVLAAYLEEAGIADGAYVIAYDHQRGDGWWSGYRWSRNDGSCGLRALGDEVFELRPEGHPRLTLPKGARLHAFVVGTNPYAYTVTAGDSKEVDHEDLAELQKLALLAGSTAAGFFASSGIEVISHFNAVATGSSPSAFILNQLSSSGVDAQAVLRATPPAWVKALTDELRKSSGTLEQAMKDMATATKEVGDSIDNLESAERFLRAVETKSLSASDRPPDVVSEMKLHELFEEIEAARKVLVDSKPICPTQLALLERLVGLKTLSRTLTEEERAEFHDALRGLSRSDCVPLYLLADDAVAWFTDNPPGSVLLADDRKLLEGLRKVLATYRVAFGQVDEVSKLAQQLLDKEAVAGGRASLLAHTFARVPESATPDHCHLTHGVLPVARANGSAVMVPWSQVRTETFTIAFDENLKGIVTPTRGKRDEKYELQVASLWRAFDIDLGLVHSHVQQPTYSAVASATVGGAEDGGTAASSEEGEGEESTPPLEIARTQTEYLSGDVAMFVSYLPKKMQRGGFSTGPQIGVGLDDEHPAAFAGWVVSIGRYLNLSGGWSWQEVEDLVPGQDVGSVVTSADDIRTRKEFENDWYVSFAITLDELPFFGGGDDEEE